MCARAFINGDSIGMRCDFIGCRGNIHVTVLTSAETRARIPSRRAN